MKTVIKTSARNKGLQIFIQKSHLDDLLDGWHGENLGDVSLIFYVIAAKHLKIMKNWGIAYLITCSVE